MTKMHDAARDAVQVFIETADNCGRRAQCDGTDAGRYLHRRLEESRERMLARLSVLSDADVLHILERSRTSSAFVTLDDVHRWVGGKKRIADSG